jgi:hypothetical protein
MDTTRTKSLTTIAILLVVLAVLSITSAVTARIGFGRGRFQGNFDGNGAQGGNFQRGVNPQNGNGGGGNFQGGGGGNFQGGNGGGFRGGGGGAFGILRNLGLGGAAFLYINIGITVIGILLALLCAYGVWKQKRWGLNLGIVVALLFLLGALPGLFFGGARFNLLGTIMSILNIGASAAIIVMGILPSVRDSVS